MQQMAATVREVSLHSNTAARSAKSAAESAREGGKIVEDVLERMRGIAQSVRESAAKIEQLGARSDEIGRIVGVIDEIAEQTNLLALNAAIEAARAGEQGRGFAVVAGEVRRLAERTAAATQEIAAVIQNVQTITVDAVRQMRSGTAAVEQGVEATGKAGESIQRIIREADTVGTMVAQIASSATQQAAATEQVTRQHEPDQRACHRIRRRIAALGARLRTTLRPGAGTAEHGGPVRRGPARDGPARCGPARAGREQATVGGELGRCGLRACRNKLLNGRGRGRGWGRWRGRRRGGAGAGVSQLPSGA